MKKVVYTITKSNWGGASRYVFDLATHLPKDQYEALVICGGQGLLSEKLKKEAIKTYCVHGMARNMNILKDIHTFFKIWNILDRERPDVLHLNSPKAAGLGAVAGRLLRIKKIIFTVHGFTFNEDRPLLQKTLIKFFSWITILLSHETVLLSTIEYNQVKKWPLIQKKLSIIPLGIDLPFFYTKTEARKKLSEYANIDLKEKIIIGTIAELHKNKGYVYAIEAIKQLLQVTYLIIGDGEERELLTTKVKECGISNIFFTGAIEDASALLPGFDLFLLPSLKEGLPYTLLEAGYLGVPVIATSVGGIPALIEHNVSGILIKAKNPELIINSIIEYLNTPLISKKYADRLKTDIQKTYTLPRLIKSTTDMYN